MDIEKAKIVHNNRYDYSLVEYKKARLKVKIICPIHGVFEQTPDNHISKKQGCPMCYGNKKSSTEEFIKKSKITHNNKYDYSLVKYINNKTKVKIICQEHGVFEQTPFHHNNRKQGCPMCLSKNKTNESVIKDFKRIHGSKYDYSLIIYKNNIEKLEIICNKHGIFNQSYTKHIQGQGCPICKESSGENEISNILEKKDIIYKREYRFNDCRNKYSLPFDFWWTSKIDRNKE